jgi:hypothetical protein
VCGRESKGIDSKGILMGWDWPYLVVIMEVMKLVNFNVMYDLGIAIERKLLP